ncbi:hypothetical protein [Neobacillus drentensis]|uniref:hypothetical protein n=1 Tax=Neobacillus drentensis TaxID=220684 RepID=UPI00285E6140|nr:hypothetical protein [Neobacillus drentensis]MDR7238746.1 hypothetical protein [Neobacillus drentensis]
MNWKKLFGIEKNVAEESNEKTKSDSEFSLLIDELESIGFLKYIDSDKINEVKDEVITSGYLYGDTGRDFLADEEDLSEGGVGTFFEEISPFLEKQGIELTINNEVFNEERYEIQVNGEKYTLYTQVDVENDEYVEINTRRAFSIINKLLEGAGSKERLFGLYGWNDLVAIFLTNEMYEIILKFEQDENERPKRMI